MAEHIGYEHADPIAALEDQVGACNRLVEEAKEIVAGWVADLEGRSD